jgi:hypothetical protein
VKRKSEVKTMTPNQLVSWFLMASYVYYELGRKIMKDTTFDYLVKRLKKEWEKSDHPHKILITKSHLSTTSGYDIKYPQIVKCASIEYLRSPNESR